MKNIIFATLLSFNVSSSIASILPIIPNPTLTPGIVDPSATIEKICTPGYSASVRNVSAFTKKLVYKLYKIDPKSSDFEIDHLISLELGGSNSVQNLWPQSYNTLPLNAYKKDRLENKLHSLVCNGNLDLDTAQKTIATDWVSAYKKYVGN